MTTQQLLSEIAKLSKQTKKHKRQVISGLDLDMPIEAVWGPNGFRAEVGVMSVYSVGEQGQLILELDRRSE